MEDIPDMQNIIIDVPIYSLQVLTKTHLYFTHPICRQSSGCMKLGFRDSDTNSEISDEFLNNMKGWVLPGGVNAGTRVDPFTQSMALATLAWTLHCFGFPLSTRYRLYECRAE